MPAPQDRATPEHVTEDKTGFEEEALPHLDGVYRFALHLSGSPDQAADLVQDTFLRAYRSWDQYTRGTSAKSWLFTICRNRFLRGRTRQRRFREIVEENVARTGSGAPVLAIWGSADGSDPEKAFFDSIFDDEVIQAIDALPDPYRTAVVLSDIRGLPYVEIAEVTDVPVGTVKSRVFRGRHRLRAVLYSYAVEMGYIPE
ncbi:MAG: sigma-70 family RNA polymerase sigma factor [Longimicrobiales bacterium]|nr:sigma-70 family RNA polymerase sigma factor [Longimicrobiales bacterium]